MPDPPSGLPFNAKPTSEDLRLFLQRYHDLPKLGASMEDSNAAMVADYKKVRSKSTRKPWILNTTQHKKLTNNTH